MSEIKIVGNIYVAGVYCFKDKDGKVIYVGSSLECNDALSRHLYYLKRGLYEETNKSILQLKYDYNKLEFEILHTSEHDGSIKDMSNKEKEDLQKALSVLEKMYIDLYKDTICNKQRIVTKSSSNKNALTTYKRRLANMGAKNPNVKYDEKMIAEILWFKLNGYKPREIQEIIEDYYNVNINSNYISNVGVQKWLNIKPLEPDFVCIEKIGV